MLTWLLPLLALAALGLAYAICAVVMPADRSVNEDPWP